MVPACGLRRRSRGGERVERVEAEALDGGMAGAGGRLDWCGE